MNTTAQTKRNRIKVIERNKVDIEIQTLAGRAGFVFTNEKPNRKVMLFWHNVSCG